jgi:hypothetical protein
VLFALLYLLGYLYWYSFQNTPPLVISEETTRVTGPLTADGYIDFLKALEEKTYPPELATDDNGFRIFVRTFGDVGSTAGQEFYRLQIYEKLGLDPNVPPTLVFPKEALHIVEDFKHEPWTLEDYPMLADWISEIDEPLDAITEMIRKPVFFVPLLQSAESIESGIPQNLLELSLPYVQTFRSIARIYQARAGYRIGLGDIDGAIDDKLTLNRLGRLLSPGGGVVQHLVGIAVEGQALVIPVGANPDHPLTEEQIQRILDGLDALPPRSPLSNALEWERYLGLSAIQTMKRNPSSLPNGTEFSSDEIARLAMFCDWNIVFRRMNEMYDALQKPEKYAGILEEIEAFGNSPRDLRLFFYMFTSVWTADGRSHIMSQMLTSLMLPALQAASEVWRRIECMENMQHLALAILLYELEHGEPYLAGTPLPGIPAKYFSCPSNPAPEGMTTYALVQYGETIGDILLVELAEPVAFAEAVVSFDEIGELIRGRIVQEGHRTRRIQIHPGGMNVVYRSGAVQFMTGAQWELQFPSEDVGESEEE